MTYELAKELKDAGFPLVKATPKYANAGWTDSLFSDDGMTVYIKPTLSELTEECGEDFGRLVRILGAEWEAHERTSRMVNEFYRSGETPEEAVAKLWLTLNK